MIFYCYNRHTQALIFKYSSNDDKHDCISSREVSVSASCSCGKDRYFYVKDNQKTGHIFAICFDGIKVRKEAAFYARHTVDMFLMANPILDFKHSHYEEIVKASVHNTKNLNSQITSKILSYLKEEDLSESRDKVAYIDTLIKRNTRGFAREVLSILRISTQISNEYNVIDYLKPGISIRKNEFGYKKLHSLLVISFYQFESDFTSKGIHVNISATDLSVYINYNTVQTLLTHLFTNALRYSMPKTNITITSSISGEYVKITFLMRSLYLTDDIIRNGRANGARSEQAKEIYPKGTGLGLGIIYSLSELNRGNFDYNRTSDKEYKQDKYIYSDNFFTVFLLKEEFYD